MMRPDARLLPERVAIQPGTLRLPSGRELRVLKPFSIGRFTVTFDEFDHYCSATGYTPKADQGWGRGTLPVLIISFDEAVNYAQWLTGMTGQVVRLPTGDEWEYAARAGTATRYCWGDWIEPCDANYLETPGFGPFPVASLRPNRWGLYNVLGNVAQWVQPDDGDPSDSNHTVADSRATRGGHWASPAQGLDLSVVQLIPNGEGSDRIGFRLAFEP